MTTFTCFSKLHSSLLVDSILHIRMVTVYMDWAAVLCVPVMCLGTWAVKRVKERERESPGSGSARRGQACVRAGLLWGHSVN